VSRRAPHPVRRCWRRESAVRLRDRRGRACVECVLHVASRGEFFAALAADTSSSGRDRDRPGPRNPVWCTSRRRVGCSSQPLPTWHGTLGRRGCRSYSASLRPFSQPLRWTDPWSHSSSSVGCQIRARRRWCELLNPATAGYRLRIGWVSKSDSATLPDVTPGCNHVDKNLVTAADFRPSAMPIAVVKDTLCRSGLFGDCEFVQEIVAGHERRDARPRNHNQGNGTGYAGTRRIR